MTLDRSINQSLLFMPPPPQPPFLPSPIDRSINQSINLIQLRIIPHRIIQRHTWNRVPPPWRALDVAPRRCRQLSPLDNPIIIIVIIIIDDPQVFVELDRQLARPTPTRGLILLQ